MRIFKMRIGVFLALIETALIFSVSSISKAADSLADYLFWESVYESQAEQGKKAAEGWNGYWSERQKWTNNIARAKAQLEKCGNCAERAQIEEELAYWQGTESAALNFLEGVFHSVGMPPAVGKLLGIPVSPFPPPQPRQEVQIVTPDWIKNRPEFCQKAVDSHISCLKSYQATSKSALSSPDAARSPGGPCYATTKLFRYCAAEDYDAFKREKSVQDARIKGMVIPEFIKDGSEALVYYGSVQDAFTPKMPPADAVQGEFPEDGALNTSLAFIMYKKGTELLDAIRIKRFNWTELTDNNNCFVSGRQRAEIEERVCDDLKKSSFRSPYPLMLTCYYTRQGGSDTELHDTRIYWYDHRPDVADLSTLVARSHQHPLLKVGEPRNDCPATLSESARINDEYEATLANLKAEIPQISANVKLPRNKSENDSKPKANKETLKFPLEGIYLFQDKVTGGSGTCTIINTSENLFDIQCDLRGGQKLAGNVKVIDGLVEITWDGKAKQILEVRNRLKSLVARTQESRLQLRRRGDLPNSETRRQIEGEVTRQGESENVMADSKQELPQKIVEPPEPPSQVAEQGYDDAKRRLAESEKNSFEAMKQRALAFLDEDIVNLEEEIAEFEGKIANLDKEEAEIKRRIGERERERVEIKGKLAENKRESEELNQEKAELKREIADIQAQDHKIDDHKTSPDNATDKNRGDDVENQPKEELETEQKATIQATDIDAKKAFDKCKKLAIPLEGLECYQAICGSRKKDYECFKKVQEAKILVKMDEGQKKVNAIAFERENRFHCSRRARDAGLAKGAEEFSQFVDNCMLDKTRAE